MAGICRATTSSVALTSMRAAAPPLMRLLRQIYARLYTTAAAAAAAAQPQLDHDYYYGHLQEESESISLRDRFKSVPVIDSEGSIPLRGVQWAFIGHPGAKKHVYAEKLSKLLEVPHISMGSLVRQDLSPRSSLYKQIANAVNQGKLVPEEIIFGLLSKRLEDGQYEGETGFILDGIPRTRIQAEILDKLVEIDLVVNFKCAEDSLVKHHGGGIFSHSQSDLSSISASASLDMSSQGTRSKYSLDSSGCAWRERAHVYAQQVKQLEDYYKKQKKLIDFQVQSAPGETWQGLLSVLHLDHIYVTHSRLTSGSSLQ